MGDQNQIAKLALDGISSMASEISSKKKENDKREFN
jgi:hypothetical protein